MTNDEKSPDQEARDSMIAFTYAVCAACGFVTGLAAMWLLTRIWS